MLKIKFLAELFLKCKSLQFLKISFWSVTKHFRIIFILVVGGQVGYMPINFQPSPAHSYGARPCQSLHKPHVLVVCALKQRDKLYLVQLEKSYLLLFSKFDSLEPVWRKSTKCKDRVFTYFANHPRRGLGFCRFSPEWLEQIGF